MGQTCDTTLLPQANQWFSLRGYYRYSIFAIVNFVFRHFLIGRVLGGPRHFFGRAWLLYPYSRHRMIRARLERVISVPLHFFLPEKRPTASAQTLLSKVQCLKCLEGTKILGTRVNVKRPWEGYPPLLPNLSATWSFGIWIGPALVPFLPSYFPLPFAPEFSKPITVTRRRLSPALVRL